MTSSNVLCCLATRIPKEHPSALLSIFLTALDARLRSNKPFTFLLGDTPEKSEAIIVLQEIENDTSMFPQYHTRYLMITRNLEENRAYIEMYPGESFGGLELEGVEQWRIGQDQCFDMDNITHERVPWKCTRCHCSYAVSVMRGGK